MSIRGLGFKRLVPPPLDVYKGRKFIVLGNWWPSTTGADKSKKFTLRVLDVDMKHIKSTSAPGTKGSPHFKVQLIDVSDPDSTGVGELVEGENFWWVTHQIFSDAYYDDKDTREKENTEVSLAAITAAAAASPATTATPPAKDYVAKTPFDCLWSKVKGERGGKSGTFFRCYNVSCPKHTEPYFVGAGSKQHGVFFKLSYVVCYLYLISGGSKQILFLSLNARSST
jgi:hypothetical protein